MRTLVDLPDRDLQELTELGKRSKTIAGLSHSRGRLGLSRRPETRQRDRRFWAVGIERPGRPCPPAENPRRMVKALFDTNILIDYLRGIPAAREELDRYRQKAISLVTWMEVLVGASPVTERGTREFLNGFELIAIDHGIAEQAVALRKAHRVKLPDAIVWASAQVHGILLVTRDAKGIPRRGSHHPSALCRLIDQCRSVSHA